MNTTKRKSKASWQIKDYTFWLLEKISMLINAKEMDPKGNARAATWKELYLQFRSKYPDCEKANINDHVCLKNRLAKLKKDYKSYAMVVDGAGIGADKRLDERAWQELIDAHTECDKWKDTDFVWYQEMTEMFEGRFATGAGGSGIDSRRPADQVEEK